MLSTKAVPVHTPALVCALRQSKDGLKAAMTRRINSSRCVVVKVKPEGKSFFSGRIIECLYKTEGYG